MFATIRLSVLAGTLLLALFCFAVVPLTADDAPAKSRPETASEKADVADDEDSGRYEFRLDHDPNGIGKFYMGREIAHVMGFLGAPWLERPEREDEEAPSKMVESLKLKPGQVAADIGAGSGVMTVLLSKAVGKKGKVVAVDVQQEMLDLLSAKMKKLKIDNVEPVLGNEKSPRIPENSIDLALMVDVYHEFEFPYEMMLQISKALKPNGRVVFVEYRKEDPKVPIKLVHKMTEKQVKREMSPPDLKLKWKETIDILPRQHIVIFEKIDEAAE